MVLMMHRLELEGNSRGSLTPSPMITIVSSAQIATDRPQLYVYLIISFNFKCMLVKCMCFIAINIFEKNINNII